MLPGNAVAALVALAISIGIAALGCGSFGDGSTDEGGGGGVGNGGGGGGGGSSRGIAEAYCEAVCDWDGDQGRCDDDGEGCVDGVESEIGSSGNDCVSDAFVAFLECAVENGSCAECEGGPCLDAGDCDERHSDDASECDLGAGGGGGGEGVGGAGAGGQAE